MTDAAAEAVVAMTDVAGISTNASTVIQALFRGYWIRVRLGHVAGVTLRM